MEQVLTAQHDQSGIHHAEPGMDSSGKQAEPRRLGQLSGGQDLAQAFALGLVVTGDQDLIRARHRVQFLPNLSHVAAEAFDRLDAQVAGRLDRGPRQGRDGDTGKLQQLLDNPRQGEQSHRVGDPLQVVLSGLVQIVRFGQHDPASRGQVIR